MYHIFFTHSSVDGHLVRFHVLAIVNSVAVNTGVHACRSALFHLSRYCQSALSSGSFFVPVSPTKMEVSGTQETCLSSPPPTPLYSSVSEFLVHRAAQ